MEDTVIPAIPAIKVPMDSMEKTDLKDPREDWEEKDHLEKRGLTDPEEILSLLEWASRDQRDLMDLLDQREDPDLEEDRAMVLDLLERVASRASLDPMEEEEKTEEREVPDLLVNPVSFSSNRDKYVILHPFIFKRLVIPIC